MSTLMVGHWHTYSGLPFGASRDAALSYTAQFNDPVKLVNPAASVIVPLHFQAIKIEETINVTD